MDSYYSSQHPGYCRNKEESDVLGICVGDKKKGTKDQRVTDADDSSVNRSLRSTKPRIDTVSTTMCLCGWLWADTAERESVVACPATRLVPSPSPSAGLV